MATITRLKSGQIVWDVRRTTMGNTTIKTTSVFPILIEEVNVVEGWVRASWNSNPSRKYYSKSIKKWKVNKPKPKPSLIERAFTT